MLNIEKIKNKIICGDSLEVLKQMPDESINCCVTSPPYFNLRTYLASDDPNKKLEIGLENTWQGYIKKLIDIFNEVKRVLKKDGTCFVNLADTFAGGGFGIDSNLENMKQATNKGTMESRESIQKLRKENKQFSAKSLMLIPERFAIAMVDSGWILRNKLIWIKPNAMPESVQDRWKKAHEYIFFFVKNKKYNFDLDSIRTPHQEVSLKRAEYEWGRNALGQNPSSMDDKSAKYGMPARFVKLNPKGAVPPDYLIVNANCSEKDVSKEHYATYPQDLIAPLIKAGCPKEICIKCEKVKQDIYKKEYVVKAIRSNKEKHFNTANTKARANMPFMGTAIRTKIGETDCGCNVGFKSGIILDPFFGSGTTGLVAKKLGRNFVGIELSKKYCEIANQRINNFNPLF